MTVDATKNLSELKKWATVRQAEYIDSILQTDSIKETARIFNVDVSTVYSAIATLRKRAAMSGYAPEFDMTKSVPLPYVVKGVSTQYNSEGQIASQWVKTKLDDTKAREAIEDWIRWLASDAATDIAGRSPIIQKPLITNDDLLSVYPMGDPHFGMYAWAEEAGDDFDLEIAEKVTKDAIDRLVDMSLPSKTALILELGDFFHADNNTAMTPKSGAKLDVDSRWVKVIQVGLRAMVYVVLKVLSKHENVIVRIVSGNHDPHSSWTLALALSTYFRNEPRVTVDLHAGDVWYYRFGKVLIGATHGDKCKSKNLPGVMACDRAKDWGETEHRFIYHGHIHHSSISEHPGVLVESFRTLAAKDAWHSSSGYRSGRDMKCIIHHKEYGEISRHTCNVAMIT